MIGNPGLIDYYIPFLTHLHSLLPQSYALLCTSHIGHEGHLPTQPPTELGDLLESKIELVTALRQSLDTWASDDQRKESGEARRAKLVLVGHSLGGWLVCEIMKRLNTSDSRGEDVIHSGHLLFPSLGWMAKTWNGKVMWVC
jgi:triacylglycerol esterase/lipase EstA (alpha/beta hydrolase family)